MKNKTKKVREMQKLIEKAGGLVYLNKDLPPQISERFLSEVMSCPDCARAIAEARQKERHREGH